MSLGALSRPNGVRAVDRLVSSIPGGKQRMASLVLKMSVSLDGYVAPADGSTDWKIGRASCRERVLVAV